MVSTVTVFSTSSSSSRLVSVVIDNNNNVNEQKPMVNNTTIQKSDVENENNNNMIMRDLLLPIRTSQSYTGYRYVINLTRCVPLKVSWSANRDLYEKFWIHLPIATNNYDTMTSTIGHHNSTDGMDGGTDGINNNNNNDNRNIVLQSFNYTIIRDPLERLYSGYWNKCLHSPKHEQHCVGFPAVSEEMDNPPTLKEFLQRNYGGGRRHNRRPFEALHKNPHFKPMSLVCHPITMYQHVFNMGDPQFNTNMSILWKRLGVQPNVVEKYFPSTSDTNTTMGQRKLSWYHSGSSLYGVEEQYQDCTTLRLAMEAVKYDYEGPYNQFFPKPVWAIRRLDECDNEEPKEQIIGISPPPPRQSSSGRSISRIQQLRKQQQAKRGGKRQVAGVGFNRTTTDAVVVLTQ